MPAYHEFESIHAAEFMILNTFFEPFLPAVAAVASEKAAVHAIVANNVVGSLVANVHDSNVFVVLVLALRKVLVLFVPLIRPVQPAPLVAAHKAPPSRSPVAAGDA